MKSQGALLGIVLLIMGIALCSSAGWGADWKQFAEATTGVFRYDAASISRPSEGLVRVWINNINKNETAFLEIRCKEGSYRVLSLVTWDESYRMKNREDYHNVPNPTWLKILPRSVPEAVSEIVCR